MRRSVLALSCLALAVTACSSAPPDETAARTGEALTPITGFGGGATMPAFWSNPPNPPSGRRLTGVLTAMPNGECPDLAVGSGYLRGRKGADWMRSWGQGEWRAYYSGMFSMVEAENLGALTPAMETGWQPFCVYHFVRTYGEWRSSDPGQAWADSWAIAQAGGTEIQPAYTPYWVIWHLCPYRPPCGTCPCDDAAALGGLDKDNGDGPLVGVSP
jgi:hypothetical protein